MDVTDLFSEAIKRINYISRQQISFVLSLSGISLIVISFLTQDGVFGERDAAQFTTGDFVSSMIAGAFLLGLGALIVFAASRTQVNSSVRLAESAQDAATKALEAAHKQVRDSGSAITTGQDPAGTNGQSAEVNPILEPIKKGATEH
jgi:hypothetical protein